MSREDVRLIMIETMNVLENDYGCDDVTNLGSPTVDEIVERIVAEYAVVLSMDASE